LPRKKKGQSSGLHGFGSNGENEKKKGEDRKKFRGKKKETSVVRSSLDCVDGIRKKQGEEEVDSRQEKEGKKGKEPVMKIISTSVQGGKGSGAKFPEKRKKGRRKFQRRLVTFPLSPFVGGGEGKNNKEAGGKSKEEKGRGARTSKDDLDTLSPAEKEGKKEGRVESGGRKRERKSREQRPISDCTRRREKKERGKRGGLVKVKEEVCEASITNPYLLGPRRGEGEKGEKEKVRV